MSKICLTCKKVKNLRNNITYKITKKEQLLKRYTSRLDGLLKSIKGKKSNLRP